MKVWFKVCLIACSMIGFGAHASLIVNGSFEENAVKKGRWDWFESTEVQGWQGSNIEIWHGLQGVNAVDGGQHIELNSHGQKGKDFSIYQTFNTDIGGVYDYGFAYRARTNRNERFEVSVLGDSGVIQSFVIDDHTRSAWLNFDNLFTADSLSTTLMFTALTPNRSTMGNLIDDVWVTPASQVFATTEVNAPATLSFLVVAGLFVFLRRNKVPSY